MQTATEIEKSAEVPDHWGYKNNPSDLVRKKKIIAACGEATGRALDIGAYEGWITGDLPAFDIYGYEISNNAAARFPTSVTRVMVPDGKYHLITATGVMYAHYNWPLFIEMINRHAGGLVVTCNIREWEIPEIKQIKFNQVHEEEFDYESCGQKYIQKLRVFRV